MSTTKAFEVFDHQAGLVHGLGLVASRLGNKMDVGAILMAILLPAIFYRICIVVYRFYFHPLAAFPGPRLAAVSTLYRAYYQVWKDGPVVRISPNELVFCNPTAYHDIYSNKFSGIKDPDFYSWLGGEADTFFVMGDPAEHRARFRPVASLFAKRHYDRCEPDIQARVEEFSSLLGRHAGTSKPCQLGMGYRSLFLSIVNDFVFSSVPHEMRTLADEKFDDPLSRATAKAIGRSDWLLRNSPSLFSILMKLPRSVSGRMMPEFEGGLETSDVMQAIIDHELREDTPKKPDSMMQRLANAHLDPKSDSPVPHSTAVLRSEAEVTMWGGVIDLANMLPLGTFKVAQDPTMQEKLYLELKSAWPDMDAPLPPYEVLRKLPFLNGVVKESMRLTHGVASGPGRRVGPGGAWIDGRFVPATACVAASSYFVHMDTNKFPEPETFDPERWLENDHSDSIVVFSKGRRMCPATHFAYIEMYSAFAAVFRRYRITTFATTDDDFQWNLYLSIKFTGRQLQAYVEKRAC